MSHANQPDQEITSCIEPVMAQKKNVFPNCTLFETFWGEIVLSYNERYSVRDSHSRQNYITAQAELKKVQRLACLSVTSAMQTTPTAAMEAMLCLLPLHLHVKKEAELGALRLQRRKTILEGDQIGHLRILREFKLTPLLTTVSDWMDVRTNMDSG